MMALPMLSPWILFWPLLAGGLFLPGYLLGKLIGTPAAALSGFLGSAIILFYIVLGLDGAGVPLGAASIGGTVALLDIVLLGLVILIRRPRTNTETACTRPHGLEWLWLIPPALGLAAIAWRATVDPLSGFDNVFRWDFLARQMLKTGKLSFYPPTTSADFTHYGWCDGIPPLIPILNLWSYVAAGKATMIATAPRVMIEAGLLFYAVWRLARGLWGAEAGWPALAALSTSSLLLWGIAMGQETGCTALTFMAMVVFLDEYRRGGEWTCLLWAGAAAGAGGLTREYALIWPFIGLLILARWGDLRSGWKIFLGTAGLIVAPWYLRNWLHTGNPLYPQGLGGLFPTNPVHDEIMGIVSAIYHVGGRPAMVPFIVELIFILTGVLLGLGLWGACKSPRLTAPLGAGLMVIALLWLWSISQTAGGWIYSTRVLTPALALAAALAAGALARLKTSRILIATLLVLISGEASVRSLCLPSTPLALPWKLSPLSRLETNRRILQGRRNALWPTIAAAANGRGIIVDHPAVQTLFTDLGAAPVPFFSPQVACMFDESLSYEEILTRLRAAHIRFILFSPNDPMSNLMTMSHAFLRRLRSLEPKGVKNPSIHLYDLDIPRPEESGQTTDRS